MPVQGEWLKFTGLAGETIVVNTVSGLVIKPRFNHPGTCCLSFSHGTYCNVRADINEIAFTVGAAEIADPSTYPAVEPVT